jgi:rhodanese-related sulfurtransferase
MRLSKTGVIVMSLFAWLCGCSAGNAQKSAITSEPAISAEDLLQQIKNHQAPVIIDVRQPEELSGPLAALPGASNIPLGELERRFQEIPKDRDVVLICRSGNRSGQAYRFLKSHGFTRIRNLNGGMTAIKEAEKR